MKTTSTITNKYPGHNTQKTAFPLCALPSDTPNRDNANSRKTDIATLQVDAIINAKLTKGYCLFTKNVVHTVDLSDTVPSRTSVPRAMATKPRRSPKKRAEDVKIQLRD